MIAEDLLTQIADDLAKRAEICNTLASLVSERLASVATAQASQETGMDLLHHQVREILMTVRELVGEIEEAA